jgi:putative ATP-dependent endonuclease of OLD family
LKLISVSIEGFRSLAEVRDLPVGSPTLLTGHNDAGKTALLDAVSVLLGHGTLNERDRTFVSKEQAEAAGTPECKKGEDATSLEHATDPERVEVTSVAGLFMLTSEEQSGLDLAEELHFRRISRNGGPLNSEYLCRVPADERLRELAGLRVPELQALVADLALEPEGTTKPYLLEALQTAAKSAPQVEQWLAAPRTLTQALPTPLRFAPTGTSDAESAIKAALDAAYTTHLAHDDMQGKLTELQSQLQQKLVDDAVDIRRHIMDRCPDIGEVQVEPHVSFAGGLRNTYVSVVAREGEDVRLGEAGAGRARRVALAVWEYTKGLLAGADAVDVVLLYDEPDTHLDYSHQRTLMKLLREQAEMPNVRMLVATHSMNLIDGVDISDVVHVRHEAHRTVLERLRDDSQVGQHLGSVAASLGLRNTVLLHERLFVGVEGVSEQAALPVLFKVATGRHLESCGIALWACNNNEGALDFVAFLKAHGRNVAFLVDEDSKAANNYVLATKKLLKRGFDPATHAIYLGDPKKLEDIFSDEQWATLGNRRWPRNDGVAWQAEDIGALRTERKFCEALLNLFKTASDHGPMRKQELTTQLALSVSSLDDVPKQLRDAFDELIRRAQ